MIVEEYDEKEFFDKSIKMLEKDYGNNFANDFKELYIKQQEEIERLKTELRDTKEHLGEYLHEQEEENKRLNNIIDKLEIDIEIGTGKYTYDTDYNRGLSDAFIYMNDRIKELKGSDSNE